MTEIRFTAKRAARWDNHSHRWITISQDTARELIALRSGRRTQEGRVDLMQYAMEADPGRLTASFPTFDTQEEAERAASFLNAKTPHLPPIHILCRDSGPGGAWSPTAQIKNLEREA